MFVNRPQAIKIISILNWSCFENTLLLLHIIARLNLLNQCYL